MFRRIRNSMQNDMPGRTQVESRSKGDRSLRSLPATDYGDKMVTKW